VRASDHPERPTGARECIRELPGGERRDWQQGEGEHPQYCESSSLQRVDPATKSITPGSASGQREYTHAPSIQKTRGLRIKNQPVQKSRVKKPVKNPCRGGRKARVVKAKKSVKNRFKIVKNPSQTGKNLSENPSRTDIKFYKIRHRRSKKRKTIRREQI
jgi:hypothetical protein